MVMARRKQLRELLGIFKDKASLIRVTLSTKRTTSSIHVAVLRCTTHAATVPPSEHRVAAVLSLGNGSRPTACACIEAIMNRLHITRNAYVALKCLLTLHNVIARGSFILKDQVSFYPTAGGRNFLNLSRFIDKSDVDTWEFSSWVRWYAGVLERNLMTSRVLGSFFSLSSSSKIDFDKVTEKLTSLLNSDLLREIEALVTMVEEICRAPESYDYQKNILVYEVVRLVSEDYRLTQHHTTIRLSELGDRIEGLSLSESAELGGYLKRLEACRERLTSLFGNRKRNDEFWDLISQTGVKLVKEKEERERALVVTVGRRDELSESTRLGKRVAEPSPWLRLLPCGGKCVTVDRAHVPISKTAVS